MRNEKYLWAGAAAIAGLAIGVVVSDRSGAQRELAAQLDAVQTELAALDGVSAAVVAVTGKVDILSSRLQANSEIVADFSDETVARLSALGASSSAMSERLATLDARTTAMAQSIATLGADNRAAEEEISALKLQASEHEDAINGATTALEGLDGALANAGRLQEVFSNDLSALRDDARVISGAIRTASTDPRAPWLLAQAAPLARSDGPAPRPAPLAVLPPVSGPDLANWPARPDAGAGLERAGDPDRGEMPGHKLAQTHVPGWGAPPSPMPRGGMAPGMASGPMAQMPPVPPIPQMTQARPDWTPEWARPPWERADVPQPVRQGWAPPPRPQRPDWTPDWARPPWEQAGAPAPRAQPSPPPQARQMHQGRTLYPPQPQRPNRPQGWGRPPWDQSRAKAPATGAVAPPPQMRRAWTVPPRPPQTQFRRQRPARPQVPDWAVNRTRPGWEQPRMPVWAGASAPWARGAMPPPQMRRGYAPQRPAYMRPPVQPRMQRPVWAANGMRPGWQQPRMPARAPNWTGAPAPWVRAGLPPQMRQAWTPGWSPDRTAWTRSAWNRPDPRGAQPWAQQAQPWPQPWAQTWNRSWEQPQGYAPNHAPNYAWTQGWDPSETETWESAKSPIGQMMAPGRPAGQGWPPQPCFPNRQMGWPTW